MDSSNKYNAAQLDDSQTQLNQTAQALATSETSYQQLNETANMYSDGLKLAQATACEGAGWVNHALGYACSYYTSCWLSVLDFH